MISSENGQRCSQRIYLREPQALAVGHNVLNISIISGPRRAPALYQVNAISLSPRHFQIFSK